tara:strand:- start:21798 stop:22694 length:897 start_codon:yes stop_codon:yes gene_type:complete
MEIDKVKFFDNNIIRKSNLSDKNLLFFKGTKMVMPSVFEISNSGMCNRKCSFCPRSAPDYDHVNEFIKKELFTKIIDELSIHEYSGTILFSGYVEPLLHKRIYSDIEYVRKKLKNVNIELITNGDPLNDERAKKLFEAGLSVLLISAYDGEDQVVYFENMMERMKIKKNNYVIRKRYFGEDKDFGITLSNRAGNLVNSEYKIMPLAKPLSKRCNYPFYTFFIDYNGDVQMCSHDWGKKMILGNLNKNTIKEIWNSKKFELMRKKLFKGDRNFSPCNVCDVKGEFIGTKHVKYWEKNNG